MFSGVVFGCFLVAIGSRSTVSSNEIFLCSTGGRASALQGGVSEIRTYLQGGPLPIINGVVTPINGRKLMGNCGEITLLIVVITPFITGRRPPCTFGGFLGLGK